MRRKASTTYLPPRCREYVLVPLIPAPLYDLACMRLVFLHCGIGKQTHVVVHIEVEQWTGLATGFVYDEIVESVMLIANIRTDAAPVGPKHILAG